MNTSLSRTFLAYRRVLSWIHQKRLTPGGKLPPQLALGRELGICQGTLSQAMALLVEDGVIKRKHKSGTTLLQLLPQNPNRRIWSAGVVMPEFGPSGYFSALTVQLHRKLATRNFLDRMYFISPDALPASEVDKRLQSDFPALENDIEEEAVNGLITCTRLQCENVPCVGLGAECKTPLRVILDEVSFYANSVRELARRGAREISVVGASKEHLQICEAEAARISPGVKIRSIPLPAITEWAAIAAATRYLAENPSAQTGAVIMRDDLMAAIFARTIALRSSSRPWLCTLSFHGSFISYALPALKFLVDLEEVASASVGLLQKCMLGIAPDRIEILIPLSLHEDEGIGGLTSHLTS